MLVTRRRPLAGLIGALAVTVVAVSGCAAGQDAQTVEQTSVVDGTAFQAGQVDLRDVGLVAPPVGSSYAVGQNAFLEGLIVNKAQSEDQLVSVTSPVATSVAFYANQSEAVLGVAPTPSESASPSDSTTPSGTGSPTDTGTPTDTTSTPAASSSAPAAPDAVAQISLPTNQSVQFGYQSNQMAIVFIGLTQALFPSQSIPITFTFANGGSVTATVSVKLPVGSSLDAPTVDTAPSE